MTPGGPPAPLGARGTADGSVAGVDDLRADAPAPAPAPATRLGGPTWLLLMLLAAALAAYAGIAADVAHGGRLAQADIDVANWVAGSMPSWAEWLARPFTWVGGLVGATAVVAAAVVWLLVRGARAEALIHLVAAVGIQLIVTTGKEGYDRPRPDVGSAIDLPSSFSFPSGHAATGIAVFGLLGLLASTHARTSPVRIGVVTAGFALGAAIGASRVVLNVHYLSDVLAGACLGLAWLVTCVLVAAPRRTPAELRPSDPAASTQPLRSPAWQSPTTGPSPTSSRSSGPSLPGSVTTFDPDALTRRLAELEETMGSPSFWDDQARATRISTEHARTTRKLERYEALRREVDEAAELLELDPALEAEVAEQVAPVRDELARLQEEALFNGEYDPGDAVVTITAGTGGTDAQDWAEMLLRMYLRWSADRGFQAELVEASPGEEAGLKSATFTVRGENAYGLFKAERGVHRLVRLSPFDSAHRRHTAFAQVVVAPLLPDSEEVEIDEGDLRIDTYRASGAGGQHVNKTDSAVRITHLPTGIVVQCQNERSQTSNKQTAMRILRSRLAELAEEEREAELAKERGSKVDVGFGSQIRSYVLHPYQMVKDHRTDHEVGNAQGVLDGALDGFVQAYLLARAAGQV